MQISNYTFNTYIDSNKKINPYLLDKKPLTQALSQLSTNAKVEKKEKESNSLRTKLKRALQAT